MRGGVLSGAFDAGGGGGFPVLAAVLPAVAAGVAAIAGLVMALTPVSVLIFRYDNPDALLVFLLVAAAWADVAVTDNSLAQAIVQLRRTIGDAWVSTHPRRGYRFDGAVARLALRESDDAIDALRRTEFGRLDDQGVVYLDYTGAGLFAASMFALLYGLTFMANNPDITLPDPSQPVPEPAAEEAAAAAQDAADAAPEAVADLFTLLNAATAEYQITGGAFFMRFGDTHYNGSSVEHLHAHLIMGDVDAEGHEPVRVKLG